MGHADYLKLGDYNYICNECGFKFKRSELRLRWDGYLVCPKDWEPMHPKDLPRKPRRKPRVLDKVNKNDGE